MKPISLRTVALAAPLLIGAIVAGGACAPDDPTTSNPGTAGTSSGAGTPASGGISTAGTPASGGISTAGTPATGGNSAAGTATGGNSTAGTATGGSGGSATGGSGGSGGAAPGVSIDSVLSTASDYGNPGWKNSWWVTGCLVKQGHDCITVNTCPAGGADPESKGARTVEKFPIGGVAGQRYKVTFNFNAVSEAKVYMGGKRDVAAEAADAETGISDTFYRDGTSPLSNYNVIKLTVFDDKGVEARHYYMNSFTKTEFESHRTFLISYTKSIVIVGGGHIEHMVQDANCHAIDNCGSGPVGDGPNDCNGGRNLPKEPATTMLPPKYKDPADGMLKNTPDVAKGGYPQATLAQPWHAQAGHLTVTAIEATTDDVKKDY